MSILPLTQVLAGAEDGCYAVGAFNVSSLDQVVAVMEAATAEQSPVIVQAIAGMSPYRDETQWWRQLRAIVADYGSVPAVVHLDHGRTVADCQRAIDAGFSSVMIDASRQADTDEPASFADNVELTRTVVALAHGAGVSVEGELGTIGGAEAGVLGVVEDIVFADPDAAGLFVAETGVDALAVAVGTSHGSVKFTDEAGGQRLRIELIEQIKRRLPDTFLVLHGSSSVPGDAVATINQYGGRVTPSYGIGLEQKQRGLRSGIRKINQGTDSHLAWTAALREFLATHPQVVEPGEQIRPAMRAFQSMVQQRMREFGSAGKAVTPAESPRRLL